MTEPNPMQFRKMGLRRRIKSVLRQRKFERKARRTARRRDREIAALVKKNNRA